MTVKTLYVRITYDPEVFSPSDMRSKIVEGFPGSFAKLGLSQEDEAAVNLAREMTELLGDKDMSLHEMDVIMGEVAEDARTVAELLLEVRPFVPAARRLLRRLRGPRASGSIAEAEEELEYLRVRREYVESLLRGDQTDAAKKFFELEKYKLGDAIKAAESRIEWLKE